MKEKHIFYKDEGYEINYIIDNTDLEKDIKLEAEQSETKKVSVFCDKKAGPLWGPA